MIYCSITLVKTMDFSPRLSVATYFRHSREGGNLGVVVVSSGSPPARG